MLKKTITYKDFNEEEVSEDFFFHLSKAELVEMELSHDGGLSAFLQKIVESQDGKEIVTEFKNIVMSSYGKKSSDGKRFVKNATIREEFESSEAYSTLFMELVTNTDSAVEFINGIIPRDMTEDMAKVTGADLEVVSDLKLPTTLDDIKGTTPEERLEIWEHFRDKLTIPERSKLWNLMMAANKEGDSNGD